MNSLETLDENSLHSRILPPFVMDPILERAFLVVLVDVLVVQHFGLVEQFMVKAEDLLVLGIEGMI